MKKILLFCLSGFWLALLLISCEKKSDDSDLVNDQHCTGFEWKMQRYIAEADSGELPATMNRDSIENGLRVFTVERAFYDNPCYYDSIRMIVFAGLEENQLKPVQVKAYVLVDYTSADGRFAQYYQEIPLAEDHAVWSTSSNWGFNPAPHVGSTPFGICTLYIDYRFAATNSVNDDWMYWRNLFTYLGVTWFYYAPPGLVK